MWTIVGGPCLRILSRHLSGVTGDNYKKSNSEHSVSRPGFETNTSWIRVTTGSVTTCSLVGGYHVFNIEEGSSSFFKNMCNHASDTLHGVINTQEQNLNSRHSENLKYIVMIWSFQCWVGVRRFRDYVRQLVWRWAKGRCLILSRGEDFSPQRPDRLWETYPAPYVMAMGTLSS